MALDGIFGKGKYAKELALNASLQRSAAAAKLAAAQGDTEAGRKRREQAIKQAGERAGFGSTILAQPGAGASAAVAQLTGQ